MQFRLTMALWACMHVCHLLFHTWPGIGSQIRLFLQMCAQTELIFHRPFAADLVRRRLRRKECVLHWLGTRAAIINICCSAARLIPSVRVCNCDCKWRKPRLIIIYISSLTCHPLLQKILFSHRISHLVQLYPIQSRMPRLRDARLMDCEPKNM